MAALNYYFGIKRGAQVNPNNVVAGTATVGTAVDIEVRVQINDGVSATGITRKDLLIALEIFEAYVASGGNNHSGAFLPAL